MSWVLLSNDDGVDSPALLPFAAALERALDLPVAICVPAGERSWSGKAISRFGRLDLRRARREGRLVATVSGTPADAVQLGLYAAFAQEYGGAPPSVVVTGVNLGFNHGAAFLASSGTVWAAAEAALAGLPAVAVSTGSVEDHASWRGMAEDEAARGDWARLAQVGAATVRAIGDGPLAGHGDLWSVNMPWDATTTTPRRVTTIADVGYGPLFEPVSDDAFRFADELALRIEDGPDTDVHAVRGGAISVTPVVLPRGAVVPDDVRASFERG